MKKILFSLLIALQSFAAFSEEVVPTEDGLKPNMIRWGTASEHENFGFDVFRGLSEQGPFEKVTLEPIPGAGTTDLPQRYEFQDADIEADRVYWYYVESISLSGERVRITPIYPSKPKSRNQPDDL